MTLVDPTSQTRSIFDEVSEVEFKKKRRVHRIIGAALAGVILVGVGIGLHNLEQNHILKQKDATSKDGREMSLLIQRLLHEHTNLSRYLGLATSAWLRGGISQAVIVDRFLQHGKRFVMGSGFLRLQESLFFGLTREYMIIQAYDVSRNISNIINVTDLSQIDDVREQISEAALSGSMQIHQSRNLFIARYPIYNESSTVGEETKNFDNWWGISAVTTTVEDVLNVSGIPVMSIEKGYQTQLCQAPDCPTPFWWSHSNNTMQSPVEVPVQVPYNQWVLSIIREDGFGSSPGLMFTRVAIGILFGCVLTGAIYFNFRRFADRDRVKRQKEWATLMKQSAEQYQKLAEEHDQFLVNMSHEIRTPMNGVIGSLELLIQMQLSVEQEDLIYQLKSSANSLHTIVCDILDFSEIKSDMMSIRLEDCEIFREFRDICVILEAKADHRNIGFFHNIQSNMPSIISLDSTRFRQIVLNIADNAIKFTDEGRVKLKLMFKNALQPDRGDLVVKIADTGIGLTDEERVSIFQKYDRGDDTTNRGTGLGLAIVRELVIKMQGDILVTSPGKGKGSTFIVKIPVGVVSREKPELSKTEIIPDSGIFHCEAIVLEDNLVNQKVAKKMLERLGVTVDIANDGQEGVEAVKKKKYDIIFMDLQMPNMDGYEATTHIRRLQLAEHEKLEHEKLEHENLESKSSDSPLIVSDVDLDSSKSDSKRHSSTSSFIEPSALQEALLQDALTTFTPIVAMTAHAQESDREKCFKVGMTDYISKPVRLSALTKVLDRYVPESRVLPHMLHPQPHKNSFHGDFWDGNSLSNNSWGSSTDSSKGVMNHFEEKRSEI